MSDSLEDMYHVTVPEVEVENEINDTNVKEVIKPVSMDDKKKCNFCAANFSALKNPLISLKNHLENEHIKFNYRCDKCSFVSKVKRLVEKHICIEHLPLHIKSKEQKRCI